jgi:hypothetical protein
MTMTRASLTKTRTTMVWTESEPGAGKYSLLVFAADPFGLVIELSLGSWRCPSLLSVSARCNNEIRIKVNRSFSFI